MSAANDELELEYYTKIINFVKSQPSNKESVEIWKNKVAIFIITKENGLFDMNDLINK